MSMSERAPNNLVQKIYLVIGADSLLTGLKRIVRPKLGVEGEKGQT